MAKRKSDSAQIAYSIAEQVAGETLKPVPEKNAAAVALGRLGGLKGGKARAKKLSPDERTAIARKAASGRWAKKV
jgi:hypothetical protein